MTETIHEALARVLFSQWDSVGGRTMEQNYASMIAIFNERNEV